MSANPESIETQQRWEKWIPGSLAWRSRPEMTQIEIGS
jgi:hypothetical protein